MNKLDLPGWSHSPENIGPRLYRREQVLVGRLVWRVSEVNARISQFVLRS